MHVSRTLFGVNDKGRGRGPTQQQQVTLHSAILHSTVQAEWFTCRGDATRRLYKKKW
jgi:hypothetical protein